MLAVAGILYGISCAPGAVWQDSGWIQHRVWHRDVEGRFGLALSHPLYYLVAIGAGHVPLGGFAHRVNYVSALAGAFAVANLFLLMRLWLGRIFPAGIAAATLALSHTFWWHASIAETYTLWAALFLGELVCLLQYTRTAKPAYLYLLGLINGMAVAVHMLGTIPLACYIVFVAVLLAKRTIRLRHATIIVLLWIVGALPYEVLIVAEIIRRSDVSAVLASAAFGDRWQADVLNTSLSWRTLGENALLGVLNFPTPNALLFFAGCYGLIRTKSAALRILIAAMLSLFLLFASRYTVADRYAFFIPFYCLVAVMIGLGADEVLSRTKRRIVPCVIAAFSLLPIGIYTAAPAWARQAKLDIRTRRDIPYRDDYDYFLRPWKTGYTGAERFAAEAFGGVEDNAVIWADITTAPPLLYAREVQGLRPDVRIVSGTASTPGAPTVTKGTIAGLLAEHPVYVVSRMPGYCPAFLVEKYSLVKAGVLWRVAPPARTDTDARGQARTAPAAAVARKF